MKYAVEMESMTRQTYYIEADTPEDAREKVLSGECDGYGDAEYSDHHVINVTEVKEIVHTIPT